MFDLGTRALVYEIVIDEVTETRDEGRMYVKRHQFWLEEKANGRGKASWQPTNRGMNRVWFDCSDSGC
jgi:hypothetical protein